MPRTRGRKPLLPSRHPLLILRARIAMTALDAILDRPTPTLRWGRATLKLETLRPTGGTDDRAVALLTGPGVLEATAGAALAAAAWMRARKFALVIRPRGVFTHEVRETLRLWGVRLDPAAEPTLPPLDGPGAAAIFARTLGAEIADASLVVAAGGARAALLGALDRGARGIALYAATPADELPELPVLAGLGELPAQVERLAVTRAQASAARTLLCRELGLLAGHACAVAAVVAAERGAVALLTSAGEREFSLDPR